MRAGVARGGSSLVLDLHDDLDGTFPFPPRQHGEPGRRIHYVDVGDGAPVLLLHGFPTWGYLYRSVIPGLAGRHRVVACDYLGFGKSDHPDDFEPSVASHADTVEGLMVDLDLRNVTLVMHDWGGPIGAALALRHPERIARLVVMNTLMPLGLPIESRLLEAHTPHSAWFVWAGAAQERGELDVLLRDLAFTLPSALCRIAGPGILAKANDTWLRAYQQPFAGPLRGDIAAAFPRSFVTGTAEFVAGTDAAVEAVRRKPAMMIYGMKDRGLLPDYFVPIFEAAFPQAPVWHLDGAGHYLQEDEPATVAMLIDHFARS